jgi:alcohol dehydrogenase class IV
MTNAVFMPYVLGANREAVEEKVARLAAYCGLAPTFDAFLNAVVGLRAQLGVPHTLAAFGIDAGQRDLIAEMSLVDPTAGGNPVRLTKALALEIFDGAMAGRL